MTLSLERGSRECRVRAAPAVSRAKGNKEKRTRAYRFSGSNPTFPAQWFYGLYRALLGERIRLVTVAAGLIADRPGWIDFATDSLAPATGVGTTRFCRTQQRRSSARRSIAHGSGSIQNPPCNSLARLSLPRPPIPSQRSVTMANAPSSGTGWRES